MTIDTLDVSVITKVNAAQIASPVSRRHLAEHLIMGSGGSVGNLIGENNP